MLPKSLIPLLLISAASVYAVVPQTRFGALANPAIGIPLAEGGTTAQATEPDLEPEEAQLIRGLGDKFQDAQREAAQILEEHYLPDSSAVMDYALGGLYFQLEERDKALQYFQTAVRKFPNFARAWKNMGMLALQMENYDLALESLVRTVELGSKEGGLYGLIGYMYLGREQYPAAESAYREAILRMPENRDWQLGLLRSLIGQEKHEESISLLESLLKKTPDNSDFWLLQSNAEIGRETAMNAAYNYEIMDRLEMGTQDIYNALGNIYLSEDIPDLALRSYMKSMQADPLPPINHPMQAAEILSARGEIDEAATLLARIEEVYHRDTIEPDQLLRLFQLKVQVSMALDLEEETGRHLNELVEIERELGREETQTRLLLASFNVRQRDFEGAYEIFRELRDYYTGIMREEEGKLSPDQQRIRNARDRLHNVLLQHAQASVSAEDYEQAISLLEQCQALEPRDNVARYLENVRRAWRNYRT